MTATLLATKHTEKGTINWESL